jgi:hypothetical protein
MSIIFYKGKNLKMKLNKIKNHTGTFLWVATTATSTPLIATDVSPPCKIALIAYSTKFIIKIIDLIYTWLYKLQI